MIITKALAAPDLLFLYYIYIYFFPSSSISVTVLEAYNSSSSSVIMEVLSGVSSACWYYKSVQKQQCHDNEYVHQQKHCLDNENVHQQKNCLDNENVHQQQQCHYCLSITGAVSGPTSAELLPAEDAHLATLEVRKRSCPCPQRPGRSAPRAFLQR